MIERSTFNELITVMNKVAETIEVSVGSSNIAELYINNPPHNYLSEQVLVDLKLWYDMFMLAEESGKFSIKGLIVTGKPKRTFSAGASLDMLGSVSERKDQERIAKIGEDVSTAVESFNKPVIAAINGICLGAGLETALSCHYRVCGRGVHLGMPESQLGFIPGGGGTQRLTRLIGRSKAQYLILSGKLITAEEALEMGIVDTVVEKKDVMITARKIAAEVCDKDPRATEYALRAISDGQKMSLKDGLSLESSLFWDLVSERIKTGGISNDDVSIGVGKKKN